MNLPPVHFGNDDSPEEFQAKLDAARARAHAHSEAHPPQRPAAAPPDLGKLLGQVERRDRDGRVTTLTVRLASFEGHAFVRVGLEENGWPVKGKSVSIRIRELGAVVNALLDAIEATAQGGNG